MKFKVGDQVKIREDLSLGKYYSVHLSRGMLSNKGKEAKITYISPDDDTCHLDIDSGSWWWSEDMLEPHTSKIAKKDLRDGDYCVFKNKERAIKFGEYVIMDGGTISLREYNKKLEHNYLAAVIAPFRDKVKNIAKIDKDNGKQYICICHYGGLYTENITLPYFKSGTMYVGMKSNKEYTLEELGL